MTPARAMVLAAGLGARMRPLSELRPKPALPALNRPILAHVLTWLESHGVTFAVINSHSHPEALEEAASRWAPPGMEIVFSREKEILGTAGGLRKAARHLRDGTFYLVNSDCLTDADLRAASSAHAAAGRQATLVVRHHEKGSLYKPVEVARGRKPVPRLIGIGGRRWGAEVGEARTFIGVHVLEPSVLEAIPHGFCDINADVYPGLLSRDAESVGAWRHDGWWFEAGGPSRYLDLNLAMLDRAHKRAVVGPGVFLDDEAQLDRAVVGEGCRLGAWARVEESVLWERVTVPERCTLRRCVVTSDLTLPPGGSWQDAVLMPSEEGLAVHPIDSRQGVA